jgi:lipoprotein signal peptidase
LKPSKAVLLRTWRFAVGGIDLVLLDVLSKAMVALLLFRHASVRPLGPVRWGSVLIVGGGGNLVDRIATGHVVDFLWPGVPGWGWRTPTFNFADLAICTGAALLVRGEMRFFRTAHARRGDAAAPNHGARIE